MKRTLIAVVLVTAGALVFILLHASTARLRSQYAKQRSACLEESNLLVHARAEHDELMTRVRDLKQETSAQPYNVSALPEVAALVLSNRAVHLTAEAREALLAELGFQWNSARGYVVVSKEALHGFELQAIRDDHATETVCGVLATTPEERASLDSLLASTAEAFRTWAVSHVQRAEPGGEVVAEYTMPFDQQFSETLSNTFAGGLTSILGAERAELTLGYTRGWMLAHRIGDPGPMTLSLNQFANRGLLFQLSSPWSGTVQTQVTPNQSMPEAFQPVFPGGWQDLAAREGFKLPKEFGER